MTRTAHRLTAALLTLSAMVLGIGAAERPAEAATPDPTQVVITGDAATCPNGAPCYSPSQVTIQAGQAVTWTNATNKTHTVTCTSAPAGVACNGDSGSQSPTGFGENGNIAKSGGTYTFQFTTPGTYLYHSKGDSPNMVGEVDVQPSGPVTFAIGTPAPTSAPAATPTPTPSPSDTALPSASSSAAPGASASPSATDSGPIGVTPTSGGGGFPIIPVMLIILLAVGAAGGAVYLNRRG